MQKQFVRIEYFLYFVGIRLAASPAWTALHGYFFFFMEKDKTNERSAHLMVSDYRRPRPRATPEELQVRCRPLRWLGWRTPALPDAKRSGIKPLLHAGFKRRGW